MRVTHLVWILHILEWTVHCEPLGSELLHNSVTHLVQKLHTLMWPTWSRTCYTLEWPRTRDKNTPVFVFVGAKIKLPFWLKVTVLVKSYRLLNSIKLPFCGKTLPFLFVNVTVHGWKLPFFSFSSLGKNVYFQKCLLSTKTVTLGNGNFIPKIGNFKP